MLTLDSYIFSFNTPNRKLYSVDLNNRPFTLNFMRYNSSDFSLNQFEGFKFYSYSNKTI